MTYLGRPDPRISLFDRPGAYAHVPSAACDVWEVCEPFSDRASVPARTSRLVDVPCVIGS